MKRVTRAAWIKAASLVLLVAPAHAGAAAESIPQRGIDVQLFVITKSENKNQVQYVARVDEHCAPLADAPVWAYWKMLELGPERTAPLLRRELPAYGPAFQSVLGRGPEGGKIRLALRALPSRPIDVEVVHGAAGACTATSTMTIAGTPAHLFGVYVKLSWPVGVDYLLIQGWSLDVTHVVTERVKG